MTSLFCLRFVKDRRSSQTRSLALPMANNRHFPEKNTIVQYTARKFWQIKHAQKM